MLCLYIYYQFLHILVQRFKIKLGLELVLDLLKPILLQKKIKLYTTFTISVWYKIIHKGLIDKK
jgi:hypothetical protein